ncbi:MAG: hypothetical protein R3F37_05365 [Candidatus Competibacteraceae bacterium]
MLKESVAGHAVHLGMAMDGAQLLRLKPQNLLLNLLLRSLINHHDLSHRTPVHTVLYISSGQRAGRRRYRTRLEA